MENNISNMELIASFSLIIIIIAISKIKNFGIGKDIISCSIRAFIQLILMGYTIQLLFKIEAIPLLIVILLAMSAIAAINPSKRAPEIPYIYWVILSSLFLSSVLALIPLTLMGVVENNAKIIIPLGGMIIANSMAASSIFLDRFKSEQIKISKNNIYSNLKTSFKTATIPVIDTTKITGLVSVPGIMVGMIMSGVSPIVAVKYQIAILYMILFSYIISLFFTFTILGKIMPNKQ